MCDVCASVRDGKRASRHAKRASHVEASVCHRPATPRFIVLIIETFTLSDQVKLNSAEQNGFMNKTPESEKSRIISSDNHMSDGRRSVLEVKCRSKWPEEKTKDNC